MSQRLMSILVLPFGLFLILNLIGCGQKVCVAGIGDCSVTSKSGTSGTSTQTGDGDLTLEASKREIRKGESVSITITNYSGALNYSISGPTGTSNLNSNTLTYSAPNDITADTSVRIKVWDARYKNDSETPLAVAYVTIEILK